MKKLIIFFQAIILIACGDDSGGSQAVVPEKRTIVATKYELGTCNNRNKTELIYVVSEDAQYLCNGIEWNILQEWNTVQSSSTSSTNDLQTITYSSSSSPESSSSRIIEYGSITDSRDGRIYRTVKIGNQTWMADNLNYETSHSRCYKDNEENCAAYGRLYNWYDALDKYDSLGRETSLIQTAMNQQGICPNGWHVPTSGEWLILIKKVESDSIGDSVAADQYHSIALDRLRSTQDWHLNQNGSDYYGFAVLPAGYMFQHTDLSNDNTETKSYFYNIGEASYFWTSPEAIEVTNSGSCYCYHIEFQIYLSYYWSITIQTTNNLLTYYSVRCIKDSSL